MRCHAAASSGREVSAGDLAEGPGLLSSVLRICKFGKGGRFGVSPMAYIRRLAKYGRVGLSPVLYIHECGFGKGGRVGLPPKACICGIAKVGRVGLSPLPYKCKFGKGARVDPLVEIDRSTRSKRRFSLIAFGTDASGLDGTTICASYGSESVTRVWPGNIA
jgi:hypothetical protein